MTTTIKLPTIKELREKGWKVRSSHYRYFTIEGQKFLLPIKDMKDEKGKYWNTPCPNGGAITLELRNPNGEEFKGEAKCNISDAFSKKEGRSRALFRALNIQPPEPKFKKGDKVWIVDHLMKAREAELLSVYPYNFEIDAETGSVVFQHDFSVKDGEGDWSVVFSNVFATKEELLEFVQS